MLILLTVKIFNKELKLKQVFKNVAGQFAGQLFIATEFWYIEYNEILYMRMFDFITLIRRNLYFHKKKTISESRSF